MKITKRLTFFKYGLELTTCPKKLEVVRLWYEC